jgi:hypothetical protein
MADLVAILEARRADYARAEAEVDTSGGSVEQSFAALLRVVTPWTQGSRGQGSHGQGSLSDVRSSPAEELPERRT